MKNNATKSSPVTVLYNEHGKKMGVLVPRKSYEKMIQILEDYEDYQTVIRAEKQRPRNKKTSS